MDKRVHREGLVRGGDCFVKRVEAVHRLHKSFSLFVLSNVYMIRFDLNV